VTQCDGRLFPLLFYYVVEQLPPLFYIGHTPHFTRWARAVPRSLPHFDCYTDHPTITGVFIGDPGDHGAGGPCYRLTVPIPAPVMPHRFTICLVQTTPILTQFAFTFGRTLRFWTPRWDRDYLLLLAEAITTDYGDYIPVPTQVGGRDYDITYRTPGYTRWVILLFCYRDLRARLDAGDTMPVTYPGLRAACSHHTHTRERCLFVAAPDATLRCDYRATDYPRYRIQTLLPVPTIADRDALPTRCLIAVGGGMG